MARGPWPIYGAPMTNESGQTSVEYAIVLSLVAIALVVSLVAINDPFANFVSDLADQIKSL